MVNTNPPSKLASKSNPPSAASSSKGAAAVPSSVAAVEKKKIIENVSQVPQNKTSESGSSSNNVETGKLENIATILNQGSLQKCLTSLIELRENIGILTSNPSDYASMLSDIMGPLIKFLTVRNQPNSDIRSVEYNSRHVVLEILNRLAYNEVLRPYISRLLHIAIEVLKNDYEENALLACKVILNSFKLCGVSGYQTRAQLQNQAKVVLDFVEQSYKNLRASIKIHFTEDYFTTVPSSNTSSTTNVSVESASTTVSSLSSPVAAMDNQPSQANKSTPDVTSDQKQPTSSSSSSSSSKQTVFVTPIKSVSSFRILLECPLMVMVILQLYPHFKLTVLPALLPAMLESLGMTHPNKPPTSSQQHPPTGSKSSKSYETRRIYSKRVKDLAACQAKTLRYLVYLTKTPEYKKEIEPFSGQIVDNTVKLMQTCPPDAISVRREYLACTQILVRSKYPQFHKHVDTLLEERILFGQHLQKHSELQQSALKPHGYSILGDLILYVRSDLSLVQLSRVVAVFSRVLHDNSLSAVIQTVSVRVLLHLCEPIMRLASSSASSPSQKPAYVTTRDLISRIFETLVHKFESLIEYIPTVKETVYGKIRKETHMESLCLGKIPLNERGQPGFDQLSLFSEPKSSLNCETGDKNKVDEQKMDIDEEKNKDKSSDDDSKSNTEESTSTAEDTEGFAVRRSHALGGKMDVKDSIQDVQALLKPIVTGLKTVIWCLVNSQQQVKDPNNPESTKPTKHHLKQKEIHLVGKYLEWGLECVYVFKLDTCIDRKRTSSGSSNTSSSNQKGNRNSSSPNRKKKNKAIEFFEDFAASFTTLDGYSLRMSIGPKIPLLFDAILKDEDLTTMVHHLMSNSDFVDVLLQFVIKRMKTDFKVDFRQNPKELQGHDSNNNETLLAKKRAALLLRMFRNIIYSLQAYPDNEKVLCPHLQYIVATCLRCATENSSSWPGHYYHVLIFLFRGLKTGKYTKSVNEVVPLLPTILNGLWKVHIVTENLAVKNVINELCLSVPAHWRTLLPHLPILVNAIIDVLNSPMGDVVFLALSTLQFWVDKLGVDFFYSVISKDTRVLTDLMTGLSNHLRPPPYLYGYVAVRLFGLLGGKNRLFIRENIDLNVRNINGNKRKLLQLQSTWPKSKDIKLEEEAVKTNDMEVEEKVASDESKENSTKDPFILSLDKAVDTATMILQKVSNAPKLDRGERPKCNDPNDSNDIPLMYSTRAVLKSKRKNLIVTPKCPKKYEDVISTKIELVDFAAHSIEVMETTKKNQSRSAFTVLQGCLTGIIDLIEDDEQKVTIPCDRPSSHSKSSSEGDVAKDETDENFTSMHSIGKSESRDFLVKKIFSGLMYAALHDDLKDEALLLIKGVATNSLLTFSSHVGDVVRMDTQGTVFSDDIFESCASQSDESEKTEDTNKATRKREIISDNGRVLVFYPFKPFGSFKFSDSLNEKINPLIFNEIIVDFLNTERNCNIVMELIVHIVNISKNIGNLDSPTGSSEDCNHVLGCDFFLEHLLSILCQSCHSAKWNEQLYVFKAMYTLCCSMGSKWSRKYDLEIIHTILNSLKSAPKEVSCAAIESLSLLFRFLAFFYGSPKVWREEDSPPIYDLFSAPDKNPQTISGKKELYPSVHVKASIFNGIEENVTREVPSIKEIASITPVMERLIMELASPVQVVRYAVRHCLSHICLTLKEADNSYTMEKILSSHSTLIKRLVLSDKSICTLSLPYQVAIVDALAFVVQEVPSIISLSEPRFLDVISELLRMAVVADELVDEKTDLSSKGIYVDKNGFVSVSSHVRVKNSNKGNQGSVTHLSSIFLRTEFIMNKKATGGIGTICVPPELPYGVQLRLSSLYLFKAILHRHEETYFAPQPPKMIEKSLGHMIKIFFRSLFSQLEEAAICAHEALSIIPFEKLAEAHKCQHRHYVLAYLKPHVQYLKDYKRLSLSSLRGFSRVLSLFPDLFYKPFGEKLLEHLQQWIDPEKIMAMEVFKVGEEPLIAVAILDIFNVIPYNPPQAPHFVEPLIETTLRLEAVLSRFKLFTMSVSPYRAPLAQYLNRHHEPAAAFFLHEKILSNSTYSELFLDILGRKESTQLREYLSGTDCTKKILQLCFHRPFLIIKTEKTYKTQMELGEMLQLHGIYDSSYTPQQLKHPTSSGGNNASGNTPKPAPMTPAALELQYQGLRIIHTLIEFDENYLKGSNHSDIVMRYRYLWRAKGRYFRVLHQHNLPAKYMEESKYIALFFMKYVETGPNEIVDILFELLRIFTQATAIDFSFVSRFLEHMVTKRLTDQQKKKVLMRFFDVLGSYGSEETKTLSIQLLILPILSYEREKQVMKNKKQAVSCARPTEGSWIKKMNENDRKFLGDAFIQEELKDETVFQLNDVVDINFVRKFVKEALLQWALERCYGDRLQIELLKISTLLIETFQDGLVDYRKDLIKFAWSHLRAEDSSSKYWAYVNICRFISVYETPSKLILQVYETLLRATQMEFKELVKSALDILVPTLPGRLTRDEFEIVIKHTKRILSEESNNILQLAHVWYLISKHPKVFYFYRHEFAPQMVNSLSRLGLPTTSIEAQTLSLLMVEALLSWENHSLIDEKVVGSEKKRNLSPASNVAPSTKKRKTNSADGVKVNENNSGYSSSTEFRLNPEMICTIVNFLVRLSFVTSDTNSNSIDDEHHRLGEVCLVLFRRMIQQYGGEATELNPEYFSKFFSLCSSESSSIHEKESKPLPVELNPLNDIFQDDYLTQNGLPSSNQKPDNSDRIPLPMLLTCLEIFISLVEIAPTNKFISKNTASIKNIIIACFYRARSYEGVILRNKLKAFVYTLITKYARNFDINELVQTIKVQMEISITQISCSSNAQNHGKSDTNTQEGAQQDANQGTDSELDNLPFEVGRLGGHCKAYFIVQLIEDLSSKSSIKFSPFVETFSISLLDLATSLGNSVGKKLLDTRSKVVTSSTPTIGVMQEACSDTPCGGFEFHSRHLKSSKSSTSNRKDRHPGIREIIEPGSAIRTLISCIRLISLTSIPFTSTEYRKKFFDLIILILEQSDSIPLLMTTCGILGTWFTSGGGPMTSKEKKVFLQKMTDIRLFPESLAQPLRDLVSSIVITLYQEGKTKPQKSNQSLNVERALIPSFLSVNPKLRSKLITLHGSLRKPDKPDELETFFEEKVTTGGLESRTPLDVLCQLICSDYEAVSDRFWLTIFVDYLIAISEHKGGICLLGSKGDNKSPVNATSAESTASTSTEKNKVLTFDQIDSDFAKFCNKLKSEVSQSSSSRGELLAALRNMSHGNLDFCEDIFENLFTMAWSSLPSERCQLALGPALELLLGRPYHAQFLPRVMTLRSTQNQGRKLVQFYTSIVKTLMRTIHKLPVLPFLDSTLLVSLASSYNTWHETIEILQRQYNAVEHLEKYGALKEKIVSSLHVCYNKLGEKDLGLACIMSSCKVPQSRHAIFMDMHDQVEQSLEEYKSLIRETENNKLDPSEIELSLWEERWVELHKELCQWSVLSEYASSLDMHKLMIESSWKSRNWSKVQNLCKAPSVLADLEEGCSLTQMNEIFLAIADGNLGDLKGLYVKAGEMCLQEWHLLPPISTACMAHNSILETFHRLIELSESGRILSETTEHAKNRTIPDMKKYLMKWKERVPNKFESLRVWENLFLWRNHMFEAIISNFKWCDPGTLATLHDRPWTFIQMARVARKQNMPDIAFTSLNRLHDPNMDIANAFSKIREQMLMFDPKSGLNMVNTTNLSYFDQRQKSECFRIKASFLASMGKTRDATHSYFRAVRVCPWYEKAWVGWGILCYSLAENSELSSDKPSAIKIQVSQYLANAMGCFFEAIQCKANKKTIVHIPRCLWMLTKDNPKSDDLGIIAQTLQDRGSQLPEWVWLPWIPNLVGSLGRVEAKAVEAILKGICLKYPQAIFYSLRASFVDQKDSKSRPSFSRIKSLINEMNKSFPILYNNMESIFEELLQRIRPSYEEEFYQSIHQFYERAISAFGEEESQKFIAVFMKHAPKMGNKLFTAASSTTASTNNQNNDRVRKQKEFSLKYKDDFERDFLKNKDSDDDTNSKTLTLPIIIERLRKWKRVLHSKVNSSVASHSLLNFSSQLSSLSYHSPDMYPGACEAIDRRPHTSTHHTKRQNENLRLDPYCLALTKENNDLAAMIAYEGGGGHFGGGSEIIEIPGQYPPNNSIFMGTKPPVELHAKLVKFDSSVDVLGLREGQRLVRRIGMLGSDGKTRHFLTQLSSPIMACSDERTAQLHCSLSNVLSRNQYSLKRNLNIRSRAVIPMYGHRITMIEDDDSHYSIDDVYKLHCQEKGIDYDHVETYYKEEVAKLMLQNSSTGEKKKVEDSEAKLKVLRHICENMVKDDILLNHVYNTLSDPQSLFAFRKAFCGQLAINCLLQYIFNSTDRKPSHFVFHTQNGEILSPEFVLDYSQSGVLEKKNMPFRLTRNIRKLMGPIHFQNGCLIPCISAFASTLNEFKNDLDSVFLLLLRDDLASWYTLRNMGRSSGVTSDIERQFILRSEKNTKIVFDKVKECAVKRVESLSSLSTTHSSDQKRKEDSSRNYQKIESLIATASNPLKLSSTATSFKPWL